MAQCNTEDLLEASACYQCIDPSLIEYVRIAIECAILKELNPMANCSPQYWITQAACWGCVPIGLLPYVLAAIGCEQLQAGGGTVCNRCEEFDPNADSACDCGHWTNTLTGEMWYWRALTAQWIKYVSNT